MFAVWLKIFTYIYVVFHDHYFQIISFLVIMFACEYEYDSFYFSCPDFQF